MIAPQHPMTGKKVGDGGMGLTSPHKKVLIDLFKPRGYRYSGREGGRLYCLRKRTPRNNEISLHFDVGSILHSCTCHLHLVGLTWGVSLEVPVVPGIHDYPVGGAASWELIVQAIAVVIDHLERAVIPRIEEIYEPAPAWFHPVR